MPSYLHSLTLENNFTVVSANKDVLSNRLLPVQENFLLKFQVGSKQSSEGNIHETTYIVKVSNNILISHCFYTL